MCSSAIVENPGRIFVTGGGTGGHVFPNLPIISLLKKQGWTVYYVGSADGIECDLIPNLGLRFFPIDCAKFRRYRSIKNLSGFFRLLFGLAQAIILIRVLRPDIVFSKGGYVSLPVALAARLTCVPLIIHESDISPGLANRFAARFAKTVCVTFEETMKCFSIKARRKVFVTGMPIREELFKGDPQRGRDLCNFTELRTIILVMGGSGGSEQINRLIEAALSDLTERFQIAHLTGKQKRKNLPQNQPGYKQFEFTSEIQHLLAAADLVVSRAGATSLLEILAARKLNILVPLTSATRGEQIENALHFEKLGVSHVVYDRDLSPRRLMETISEVLTARSRYEAALARFQVRDGTEKVCELIREAAASGKSGRRPRPSRRNLSALTLWQ